MIKPDKKYIIWLGTVFTDITVEKTAALSPAGNKWQLRFINGIKKTSNLKLYTFGHRLERSFPKGKLYISSEKNVTPPGIDQKLSWYVNLPYLRNFFINSVLLFKLIYLIVQKSKALNSLYLIICTAIILFCHYL